MLTDTEKKQLKDLALASIRHGLQFGEPLPVDPFEFGDRLQEVCASFVTLHRFGELRGCMGTLQARRPLVEDVVENAYAAAFLDSRFSQLSEPELDGLDLHVSVLSPYRRMSVSSEHDLLEQLRPGTDGLVLELGMHKATFLPSVWEKTPNPADFLNHLKRKAGLDPMRWDDQFRFYRYTTDEF